MNEIRLKVREYLEEEGISLKGVRTVRNRGAGRLSVLASQGNLNVVMGYRQADGVKNKIHNIKYTPVPGKKFIKKLHH